MPLPPRTIVRRAPYELLAPAATAGLHADPPLPCAYVVATLDGAVLHRDLDLDSAWHWLQWRIDQDRRRQPSFPTISHR